MDARVIDTCPETGAVRSYHDPESGYRWHLEYTGNSQSVKVIDHPGVYLVGFTRMHDEGVKRFLDNHGITGYKPWGLPREGGSPECPGGAIGTMYPGERNGRGTDSELLVELAGRLCYMSYDRPRPGGLQAFIANLVKEGHGSVFEHPHYSFILSGVSRNLTLEGNRHRTFSISQLSGRFVDAAEVGFVMDPDLSGNETDRIAWAKACRSAFDDYEAGFRRKYDFQLAKWRSADVASRSATVPGPTIDRKLIKKTRERARDILPGCLETRVLYTVNTRAIRFIFEKRCHTDAAFEIRRAFNGVYSALKAHDPKLFEDFSETALDDGTFAVHTAYPKI